ncbi:hypothetical protein [Oceanihabitans sediminis]|uniref:hypothetical protein n=1 Tax=Oceanihabitans sediminis TaxID=1812012 RepID=UPI00299F256B|nr:hypothetical protein [Oceanihabitans sediminis]MDX1279515.1 hypothetical protein [Oceanihabitans sediminis]
MSKGNVLKVIELGLQDRVYQEMKKPKFSVERLTRKLKEEGVNITSQSIRKFIKKTKKAQQELIQRDIRAATEFNKLTMNYSKALKDILAEVDEVKNTAKEEKDMATYNQLVGRLMQGIELIAKLTGDIKPKGSIDINIVYNEINNDIEKKMKNMKTEIFKDTIIDVDAEIIEEDKRLEEELNRGQK